jgi:ATP-dependent Clp protease adaptor protein ClpS
MFDVLLADLIVSGSSEWPTGFAVAAVAGGLLLGYLLAGALTRPRDRQESTQESTGEPLYAVVLHNDDFNTFGFVIGVLGNVFAYAAPKGFWLALKIHCTGRGVVWSGTLEAAQQKAAEIRSYGPDPNGRRGVAALKVSVEPLPA